MRLKNNFIKTLFVFSSFILIAACKEATTEPPVNQEIKNYFPNAEGSYFLFNISVNDSAGSLQSGERNSYYIGDTTLLLTSYQIKVDTIELNGTVSTSNIYFRKSVSGVFGYFDTTGVTAIVPDSLRDLIQISTEYRLLYFPLSVGQTWPVYNVSVDLGVARIDIVDLSAQAVLRDTIEITFNNKTLIKEIYKLQYDLEIITGSDLTTDSYQAFAWIMEDIGFYKWEGDSELINFFTGTTIYPLERIIIEELSDFNIQ